MNKQNNIKTPINRIIKIMLLILLIKVYLILEMRLLIIN